MAYDQDTKAGCPGADPGQPRPVTSGKPFRVGRTELAITPVFDAYWHFAAERQRVFFRRLGRTNQATLSHDPVLQHYKFTNAYRASDRVSQYLLRSVIYDDRAADGAEDVFFRILLFKIFNKIGTWEALQAEFGDISLSSFNFDAFNAFLSDRQDRGERNYAAAYIMPSAGHTFGYTRKHSNHLALIAWMIEQNYPRKLSETSSMKEGFELFAETPSLGPFLAYQFITDINYSPLTSYSEMEFVVPGPGALDGISKCFANARLVSPTDIIKAVAEQQDEMFAARDIAFPSLWGRPLQLIDCQNLFCEISKYSRVAFPDIPGIAGRTRIKQKYKPSGPSSPPFYPPDWGINERVADAPLHRFLPGSEIANTEQLTLF